MCIAQKWICLIHQTQKNNLHHSCFPIGFSMPLVGQSLCAKSVVIFLGPFILFIAVFEFQSVALKYSPRHCCSPVGSGPSEGLLLLGSSHDGGSLPRHLFPGSQSFIALPSVCLVTFPYIDTVSSWGWKENQATFRVTSMTELRRGAPVQFTGNRGMWSPCMLGFACSHYWSISWWG